MIIRYFSYLKILTKELNIPYKTPILTPTKKKKKVFLMVPYIDNSTLQFRNIAKKHNLNTIFMINRLSNFIKTCKDRIEKMQQSNVVYKISCNDCDATYVGQTKRQLQTRIREHRTDINRLSGSPSIISSHS